MSIKTIQPNTPFVLNDDLCMIITDSTISIWSNENGLVAIMDEEHELIQYSFKLDMVERSVIFDQIMRLSCKNKTLDFNLFKKQPVSFTVSEPYFEVNVFIQDPKDILKK